MEIERIIKRLETLSSDFKDSYIKDISKIVNLMLCDYDIFYKGTREPVKEHVIINKFTNTLLKKDTSVLCSGISKNGNRCTKRAKDNSYYCKTHSYLDNNNNYNDNKNTEPIVIYNYEDTQPQQNFHQDQERLELKFIEDSFYYIDEKYIYDKDTLQNVGYIHDNEYILSNDPFVNSNDPFVNSNDPFVFC